MTAALVVAVVVTASTVVLLLRVLPRTKVLVDVPNERSSHSQPTLRGGGIAVLVGLLSAVVAMVVVVDGEDYNARMLAGVVVAAVGFGLIGLVDDLIRGVAVAVRLSLQLLVALALVVVMYPTLTGSTAWKVVFAMGVTVWMLGYVNAFNFMDGINGISAMQAIVAGISFALLGFYYSSPNLRLDGIAVAAVGAAFLPFNFPKARIFLGDVGSYALGAWIARSVVSGIRMGIPPEVMLAPVAIYVADTSLTLWLRMFRGEDWRQAHREHAYQRAVEAGWSHTRMALTYAALATAIAGVAAVGITGSVPARVCADVGALVLVVAYLRIPSAVQPRQADHSRVAVTASWRPSSRLARR